LGISGEIGIKEQNMVSTTKKGPRVRGSTSNELGRPGNALLLRRMGTVAQAYPHFGGV